MVEKERWESQKTDRMMQMEESKMKYQAAVEQGAKVKRKGRMKTTHSTETIQSSP